MGGSDGARRKENGKGKNGQGWKGKGWYGKGKGILSKIGWEIRRRKKRWNGKERAGMGRMGEEGREADRMGMKLEEREGKGKG